MRYLIQCRGGSILATPHDRFLTLDADGARRAVPAEKLSGADLIAGLGRVLRVTTLSEAEAA